MKLQRRDGNAHFEVLARAHLAEHSFVPHKWHSVENAFTGGDTELVCFRGTNKEVAVSLRSWQIAVTACGSTQDFEDFGRGLSEEAVALEAFAYFRHVLDNGA